MPSNLWCSITVNPMKLRWLCINQCHVFTERWAAVPWDVLKTRSGLWDSRRAFKYWFEEALRDRSCESENLLYVFVNLSWADSKKVLHEGESLTIYVFFSANTSKDLKTRCSSLLWGSSGHGCAEETQEEVANDSMFTQAHTQQDRWLGSYPFCTTLTLWHRTGTIYSIFT